MRGSVSLREIYLARQRIKPFAWRTPLVEAPELSGRLGARVVLKVENLQVTGSFKIRGASNKILSLIQDERAAGVVAVSSGNHGRAVCHVAAKLGVRAVVCLPETVPDSKVQAIRALGAETIVRGATYDEAAAHANRLQEEQGLTMIHPFDDPWVIAGQGTIGLELLEDDPEIGCVVVPLSGGGLVGGIGLTLKSAFPGIRVVGVSMERGPAMVRSLEAGRIVEVVEEPTLADALMGGLGPANQYTIELVRRYVDETVLVSEDEIAGAMAFVLEQHHLVVEGGGAVGLAALLYEKVKRPGTDVAVVISGGNVSIPTLLKVVQDRNLHGQA